MLKLSDQTPFTIGGTRQCYIHPDHPDRCVKVLRPDRTPEVRRSQASFFGRLLPLRSYDDQWKEVKAYLGIDQTNAEAIWEHVPEFFGTIETDLGVGVCTRLFRNYDGHLPDMLEPIARRPMSEPVIEAIQEFQGWLRATLFLTRHLLPHNLIVVYESENKAKLVLVDGIGNAEFIPLSSWFRYLAKRKVERKIAYMNYRIKILRQPTS